MGTVQELRFDGDYVVSVKDIPASDIYNTTKYNASTKIDDEEVYFVSVNNVSRGDVLQLEGRDPVQLQQRRGPDPGVLTPRPL